MAEIFAYKNQLWKCTHHFSDVGYHKFSLEPGKYLLVCRGAKGGKHYNLGSYQNLGGTSVGEINLTKQETMYAYIGGNGGDAPPEDRGTFVAGGIGGFNGGGNGGDAPYTGYWHYTAAGGGGASDIRVHAPGDFSGGALLSPTIPDGYTQVEYLQSDGTQYFNTGYIAKENTTFVFSAQYDKERDQAILGAQQSNADAPGWMIWLNNTSYSSSSIGTPGGRKFMSVYGAEYKHTRSLGRLHNVPTNKKATYRCDKYGTFVNEAPLYYNPETLTEYGPDPNMPILFLTAQRGDDVTLGNRMFVGKVYFLRIYELENDEYIVKHEFIPCIRNTDHAIGLYDTITSQFIEQIKTSETSIKTGPIGPFAIDKRAIAKRDNYPDIPDEYSQLEYIEGTGSQYFKTDYVASREKDTTMTFRVANLSNNDTVIFGSQSAENTNPAWLCWLSNYKTNYTSNIANVYGTESWSSSTGYMDTHIYSGCPGWYRVSRTTVINELHTLSTRNPSGDPDTRPIYIFNSMRGNSMVSKSYVGRLYHFNIYEKEDDGSGNLIYVLKHSYIPCMRKADNVVGLYDILADDESEFKFITPTGSGIRYGPIGHFPIVENDLNQSNVDVEAEYNMKSLNTRIIVAGGGAGAWQYVESYPTSTNMSALSGVGGGAIGGCVIATSSSSKHYLQSATQIDGYQFGVGEKGTAAYGQSSPSSGGGGGWFGGFTGGNGSAGGGGSGYVLTESSYKPAEYMEDYQPYILTNIMMSAGTAEQSEVCIYEPYKSAKAGDVITAIQTGECVKIDLMPGQYKLKCYGGDGGVIVNPTFSARGGYSEGILHLNGPDTAFLYVAGSGLHSNMISHDYVHQINPFIAFNGGGQPKAYGNNEYGMAGGGASDIRFGEDSLYARIIVAGGAGGQTANRSESRGGAGGGETGGTGTTTGSYQYGYHPGPGTQTGSPIEPACEECNGGFGYGGNMPSVSGTYYGPGAGGSGWFGGSSTYVTSTSGNNIKGGSGGSGYVLTESSYKPDGYILGSTYYLTDATTVRGGNTLPVGVSKIVIEVLTVNISLMLCRDMYGLKRYDSENNTWVLLGDDEQSLEESTFVKYGTTVFLSDDGLANDYEIIIFDPDDVIESCDLNVTPHEYVITHETMSDMKITNMKQNASFDPNVFDVNIIARRRVLDSGNVKIITTFKITKKVQSDDDVKIFYLTYYDSE